MTFVLDLMHVVAAALLAVVGLGYEREEDCAPVHFQPAAHVIEADAASISTPRQFEAHAAVECDSDATVIVYPVL